MGKPAAITSARAPAEKSWQAYVDSNLLASGMVTSAGIYDLQGNPWAYSAGFAAQVAEVAAVAGAMAADPTALAASGVWVAGVKYMFVSGDADEVYVKKGNKGVVFAKCNTCIIVGYHGAPRHQQAPLPIPRRAAVEPRPLLSLVCTDDKIQPGACRTTVGKLADFLKENGI